MLEYFKTFLKPPCTFWFNGIGKYNWVHCCKKHDEDYARMEFDYDKAAYRLMVDKRLKDCVNKEMSGMGWIMFLGVRIGGFWSLK